jgi:hypothetical protein
MKRTAVLTVCMFLALACVGGTDYAEELGAGNRAEGASPDQGVPGDWGCARTRLYNGRGGEICLLLPISSIL